MRSNSKKRRPAKEVSRSEAKTIAPVTPRKAPAKKSVIGEKVIRAPIRSGEADPAILFFDEADALFGKRTAVRDSHDRHANLPAKSLVQDLRKKIGKKTIKGSKAKKQNAL